MSSTLDAGLAWTREEFESRLRAEGRAYHIHHPYNTMLNTGQANREQIQGWVANRFYYQQAIPLKDGAVLSACDDRAVRQEWVQRILDHDGQGDDPGGIEAWLQLAEAVGLTREEVADLRHVLPGVRFAVDAYINFARERPWQESVCASLTELFAPQIHKQRLATWPQHYPWIESGGLLYFRNRVSQARRDVDHGLAVTLDHFNTRQLQERALDILRFKLDILWQISDAMAIRYGLPDWRPLPTLAEISNEMAVNTPEASNTEPSGTPDASPTPNERETTALVYDDKKPEPA